MGARTKPSMISARKLQANRANAKKSTGPRTPQGKTSSRRNALRHGLTSRVVLLDSPALPMGSNLLSIAQVLKERLAVGSEGSDPAVESIVLEYLHQQLAAEIEVALAQNGFDDSHAPVSLHNLIRYRTASQRALLKSFSKSHGPRTKE